VQNAHETKFLLPTHLSALTPMTTTWESSLSVAKEKTFLAPSSMMAFLGEKDARGLTDAAGAEGVPPDLLGVAAADGVVLALAGHAVGGAHWQAMQSVVAGPALMALPVVMDMEAVLEVALSTAALHLCQACWMPSAIGPGADGTHRGQARRTRPAPASADPRVRHPRQALPGARPRAPAVPADPRGHA
jgi:hypothetical protein